MNPTNVVIAGVNKGGTTSLFSYLATHPDVCASSVKETCFFLPLRYGEAVGPLSDYAAFFEGCGEQRCRLESTPGYFYGGRPLARAIETTLEDVHVIIVLRDPIERLYSFFKFMKSMLRLEREMTFEQYVERCLAMPEGERRKRVNNVWWGVDGGYYARDLPAWLETFGPRARVLFFDDLCARPLPLLRELSAWLGLGVEHFDDGFELTVENRTVPYQNALVHRAALAVNRMGERLFRANPALKRGLRGLYQRMNRGKSEAPMSGELRARLVSLYEPHNAELRGVLDAHARGASLPPWLSERPG